MSAIPRPKRAALPGEIVNYFEAGDPTEVPIPATVHQQYGGNCTITYQKPGQPTVLTKYGVKHIHDPYWDNVSLQNKQACGAFDFHPVFGVQFEKWQAAEHMRVEARKQREAERAANTLSDDEFNAINALERHGDNLSAIRTDTGLTESQLKKLPKFMEAWNAIKEENFRLKQDAKAGK